MSVSSVRRLTGFSCQKGRLSAATRTSVQEACEDLALTRFTEERERHQRVRRGVSFRSFYEQVFGLPLTFEDEKSALFKFENVMVMVRNAAAARSSSFHRLHSGAPRAGQGSYWRCSWMM